MYTKGFLNDGKESYKPINKAWIIKENCLKSFNFLTNQQKTIWIFEKAKDQKKNILLRGIYNN